MEKKRKKDIRFCFKITKEAHFSVENDHMVVRHHKGPSTDQLVELRIQSDKPLSLWERRRIHQEARRELITQLAIPSQWVKCMNAWIYDRSQLEKTSL